MHGTAPKDGQDTLHSVTLFDDEVDTAFVMMGVSFIDHARWTVTQAALTACNSIEHKLG